MGIDIKKITPQSTPDLEIEAMSAAAQTAAKRLGLKGVLEEIRVGRTGVFRFGDSVVKVCPASWRGRQSIEREISVIDWVTQQGILVPQLQSGVLEVGKYFVLASEFIANQKEQDWKAVGNTIRLLHQLRPENLELFDCQALVIAPLSGRIEELFDRNLIKHSEAVFLKERLDLGIESYSRDDRLNILCHGDLHEANIIFTSDGPYLLDWEKAGWGLPEIDLSKIVGQKARGRLSKEEIDAFLVGYDSKVPLDDPNIKSMRLISEVSGITYLIGSSSLEQAFEGRRRLEGLISGREIRWRNC